MTKHGYLQLRPKRERKRCGICGKWAAVDWTLKFTNHGVPSCPGSGCTAAQKPLERTK